MKKIFNKIISKIKTVKLVAVLLFSIFGIFLYLYPGNAQITIGVIAEGAILSVVGALAQLLILVAGAIITVVIYMFIGIAQYNSFINEPTIIQAWVVVRDLCNMFFILVLLLIAFAPTA